MNEQKATPIHNLPFHALLQNRTVVRFVRCLIKESYQAVFAEHSSEMGEMVDDTWELLLANARGESGKSGQALTLSQTVAKINRDIFRKQDPDFWFNSIYKTYKTQARPQKDFINLQPYLSGKRVLDFGSGGGYLALRMSQNGYEVTTTDVIDYRVEEARHLPFRAMASATDIPYPDGSFDTAIVKAVLHHVDARNLPKIIQELRRVSQRLIVEEDTYDLPADTPDLTRLSESQPQLRKFMALSRLDQLQALMLMDYFANAIAQGVIEMNFPFQFKTIPAWRSVLEQNGLWLTQVRLLGFQEGNVNKSCHIWLIADRRE